MTKLAFTACLALAFGFAGCTSTTTTQMAQNVVRIDVSAAPVCGAASAQRLIGRMAAVETLRQGYDRYRITFDDRYESTVFAFAAPADTFAAPDTRNAALVAVMYRDGDPAGRDALDAREALGRDWQTVVARGSPNTCSG